MEPASTDNPAYMREGMYKYEPSAIRRVVYPDGIYIKLAPEFHYEDQFDIDQLTGEIIKYNRREDMINAHLILDRCVDVYCAQCGEHKLELEEHYLCEDCRKLP